MTDGLVESSRVMDPAHVLAGAGSSRTVWRRGAFWEAIVWLVLCSGWIWSMSLGDRNGFGYFHQPQNSLLAPLILGGIINAAAFWTNAFLVIPRYLASSRWRIYLGLAFGLIAANVALQAATQKLIIMVSEPRLASLSWAELALENTYLAVFVIILSTLYKFARDWTIHRSESSRLQARAYALQRSLLETREELRNLQNRHAASPYLKVKSGTERLKIPVCAIKYVKSAGNYLDIVTPERSYMVYGALKDIVHKLPRDHFIRVHRSYLVGLQHIQSIKGDVIQLDTEVLPIGAVYRGDFLTAWERLGEADCPQR